MVAIAASKFSDPHALELLAVEALERNDAAIAFGFADRRCRISSPRAPHTYVIRSEALYRLGDKRAALSDLTRALLLDPENLIANRRMMSWGGRWQQERAAKTLIKLERGFGQLREAIDCLRLMSGQEEFGAVTAFDAFIEGWALWKDETPLEVTVSNEENISTVHFYADPGHPFSDLGFARSFSLPRSETKRSQHISIRAGRRTICSVTARRPVSPIGLPPKETLGADASLQTNATVVVPIFEDLGSTKKCLESLLDELDGDSVCRVVLVDDASPNQRIKRLLQRVGEHPRITVLTNSLNLGFSGAVNRALSDIPEGDVVLLNADTIAPAGFLTRLSVAARSSPDIGIVMPLSNNGDLASFPALQEVAPLGSRKDIEQIDRCAMGANAGHVVDIPNCVGFCMYITRACLDRVGLLSESFGRGYFEDVEFSLRARECGFRCVCAPSVYIGHAGSKSFKTEKLSLVARNSEVLRALYPKYELEFAAFAALDPLRSFREAIATRLGVVKEGMRIVVSGEGVVGETARRRAEDLRSADQYQSVLLLNIGRSNLGFRISVSNAADRQSQPLRFYLRSASDAAAFRDLLSQARGSRVEIFDPIRTPLELVDIIQSLKLPFSIAIADAGLLGRAKAGSLLVATRGEDRSAQDDACRSEQSDEPIVERWRKISETADTIFAMDEFGRAFGSSILPSRTVELAEASRPITRRLGVRPRSVRKRCVGFLPIRTCAQEFRLISAVIQTMKHVDPHLSFVIIGATFNDAALMGMDGVHVTGLAEASEVHGLVDRYAIAWLFLSAAEPLFGHPLVSASFECRRPLAYFDWSSGAVKAAKRDLPLNPSLSLSELVRAIANWVHMNSPGAHLASLPQ